jgi:hypothetical protein
MAPKRQAKKHFYKQNWVDDVFGGNNKEGQKLARRDSQNFSDTNGSFLRDLSTEKTRTAVVREDGKLQLCSRTLKGRYVHARRRRFQEQEIRTLSLFDATSYVVTLEELV